MMIKSFSISFSLHSVVFGSRKRMARGSAHAFVRAFERGNEKRKKQNYNTK